MIEKERPLVLVRVWLLGPFRVECRRDDGTWEIVEKTEWDKGYTRPLLKRLLCASGRRAERLTLLDDLWPHSETPELVEQYLNSAVYRLRKVLRATELVQTFGHKSGYLLADQSRLWVDADACEALLKEAERIGYTSSHALPLLEQASAYFARGTFLEGEAGLWSHARRGTMERMQYRCHLWLAEAYEQQGLIGQAEMQYSRLLEEDPTDEHVLRLFMGMLQRQGMTHQALRCYEQAKIYAKDAGVELSAALEAFAKKLTSELWPVDFSTGHESPQRVLLSSLPTQSEDIIGEAHEREEQDMNRSRRGFIQALLGASFLASYQNHQHDSFLEEPFPQISEASLQNLENITWQFRAMQRRGDVSISHGLAAHLATIQETLEITSNERLRRGLWRLMAQAQIVARLNPIKKYGVAKAKTFNEAAIASAQHSGDTILMAAAIGHLAHLYLREDHDLAKATQLLTYAQEHIHTNKALKGWFAIVMASIAAQQGNEQECEALIADAMDMAHQTQQETDPYCTDFGVISVRVFAGNCWLTLGKPQNAYLLLTSSNIEELSINRQASAYYDIARAYSAAGELEAAQQYAFRSIDLALATHNEYIVPRFLTLTRTIQQKYHDEPHAAAIAEYAQHVLPLRERNAAQ